MGEAALRPLEGWMMDDRWMDGWMDGFHIAV
jgi:hypothetical protein